jgi:hypothetical protein
VTARSPGRRPPADGWQASKPELTIAAILVAAGAAGAYAWAGAQVMLLVLGSFALLALAVLRSLAPPDQAPEPENERWDELGRSSIVGFWRKRGGLSDATRNRSSYELELRLTLQHLLAARLAERHGISLYADPEAARRLLLPNSGADLGGRPPWSSRGHDQDAQLWYWVDPTRPPAPDQQSRGIPPRTLSALLDRLEHL